MAIRKQSILKIVNPAILILIVVQAGTGIFHELIPYVIFETLHIPSGYLLTAGAIVHIILNWKWFKTAFRKRSTSEVSHKL